MRVVAYAALFLSVLALAACADDGGAHTWAGPPDPGADGTVAVEDFADHQGNVDEPWEGSAAMAAAEFLRLDEQTAATTTIEGRATGEGAGPETVTVTLDGLFDDSVRAERWTLEFEPDGEDYLLVSAAWAQRCQLDRGHQDFSPDACI